ncbi:hypothetical protein EON64_19425 [archaeon]|nr:MAG: hypothetical protein EON64_19425 [archaeon]
MMACISIYMSISRPKIAVFRPAGEDKSKVEGELQRRAEVKVDEEDGVEEEEEGDGEDEVAEDDMET